MQTVLVVEDESNLRKVISAHLKRAGYRVLEAHSAPHAMEQFQQAEVEVIVTDLMMRGVETDGMDLLRWVIKQTPAGEPPVPVLLLTAYGTADRALEAISQGAWNLISKPCDMEELLTQVANAAAQRQQARESRQAQAGGSEEELPGRFGMIGRTAAMTRVFDTIARVADSPSTVLILGESGTGKELVASALHQNSSRRHRPFIAVNLPAINENLIESELFGHEKGAYSGAHAARIGRLENADGGTLFIDEIGDLRPDLQVKLLRALQERAFERVGGSRTIKVDVRMITATHRDLPALVKSGQFREDLYYRLNVVPIHLPPLRERLEDIPLLVEHFRRKHNRQLNKEVAGLDKTLLSLLERLPWPGNIRELESVIERMMLLASSTTLGIRDLPPEILVQLKAPGTPEPPRDAGGPDPGAAHGVSLKDRVREQTSRLEKELILRALDENHWNITRTASFLGLSRKGLQLKMKELDIRRPDE